MLEIANTPLLPLKEALKSVEILLPDLQQRVYVAKESCTANRHDLGGLSVDESASICIFTMEWEPHETCLYPQLNRALRLQSPGALDIWSPYLKLFLTALRKLPSFEGILWRGVYGAYGKSLEKDYHRTWWGVSAASKDMHIFNSSKIFPKEGERTLFAIECHNAKNIYGHSYFSTEDEYLLLPPFHFEVVSKITSADGLYIIGIKEIDSTCDSYAARLAEHEPELSNLNGEWFN